MKCISAAAVIVISTFAVFLSGCGSDDATTAAPAPAPFLGRGNATSTASPSSGNMTVTTAPSSEDATNVTTNSSVTMTPGNNSDDDVVAPQAPVLQANATANATT